MSRVVPVRWLLGSLLPLALGCGPSLQRLKLVEVTSKRMGREMKYGVFQPRDASAEERLPLVIFLHGIGDGPGQLEPGGVTELLDQPGAPRAIIVSPQGDRGFWENWANGERPYRDWILDELIPRVQEQYSTLPCPEHCHVMGISMGGHGALSMALHAPGRFASITAMSAPIFQAEKVAEFYDSFWWGLLLPVEEIWGPYDLERAKKNDPFRRIQSAADLAGSRLAIAWGTEESEQTQRQLERFVRHLEGHDVPHEAWQFPGEHEWKAWAPAVVKALRLQLSRE